MGDIVLYLVLAYKYSCFLISYRNTLEFQVFLWNRENSYLRVDLEIIGIYKRKAPTSLANSK